jgi:hypothetical protein
LRYARWELRYWNSAPSRHSLLSREQSREGARFSIPAALHVIVGCVRPNGIAAKEDRLTAFFGGRELFVATDRRFPGPPGKVGLWTRADSMTWFESLKIGYLD